MRLFVCWERCSKELRERFSKEFVVDDTEPVNTFQLFVDILRRLQNWASPGLDGIQGYLWKKMISTHKLLCSHFCQLLTGDVTVQLWFPHGRTLLLPKCKDLSAPRITILFPA